MAEESLWTAQAAAQATHGKAPGEWQAQRVVIDSRQVRPGDMFVAIKGERMDGHQFVPQALRQGAVTAMVSTVPDGLLPAIQARLLHVADTLHGLEDLARAARARSEAVTVGITGSVGKTSTREAMVMAFAALGPTHGTSGNLNNHIGLPLTVANLPQQARFGVFEMGMNHAGEIAALSRIARPHVAVITSIAPAHLEFFASVEAIADAKAEIFEGVESGGAVILNCDNAYCEYLEKKAVACGLTSTFTYGETEDAYTRMLDFTVSAQGCVIKADVGGKIITYRAALFSRHLAKNTLAALTAVSVTGADVEKAAAALAAFSEPAGRGKLHALEIGGVAFTLVDDSYNASPESMRAALANLGFLKQAGIARGRLVVVLGDMLEMGETAPAFHAELAKPLARHGIECIYTAGPLMAHLAKACGNPHYESAEAVVEPLIASLQTGDVVLVKGSHGSQMVKVAEALLAAADNKKGRANAV